MAQQTTNHQLYQNTKKQISILKVLKVKKTMRISWLGWVEIIQKNPENSTLKQGFNKMSTPERETLEKLFDIAYFLAKKARPCSDFFELISLQKMHGVKFSVSYNNNKSCNEFISFISKSTFEESIKSKIIQTALQINIIPLPVNMSRKIKKWAIKLNFRRSQ